MAKPSTSTSLNLTLLSAIAELGETLDETGGRIKPYDQAPLGEAGRRIERELGIEVVTVKDGRLVLTEAGARLRERAAEILSRNRLAIQDVANVVRRPSEMVTFGMPPTVAAVIASRIAISFDSSMPSAKLRFVEGMSTQIREWLATSKVDVGVLYETTNVSGERLWTEELSLVGDVSMLPSGAETFPFSALRDMPLILPGDVHGLRQLIDRHAERHSVPLSVVIEADSLNIVIDLVIAGMGYAVLPSVALAAPYRALPRLKALRLTEPRIERDLVLATSSNKVTSPAVRTLMEIVRKEAAAFRHSSTESQLASPT